jgi:hypothetical protein
MKTFVNTKTEITQTDEKKNKTNLGFADLSLIALNTPPQGGWTPDDMRKRLKVMSKLEDQKLGAKIKLEDAEFAELFACKDVRWKFMHKDVVAFDDYLIDLNNEK